MQKTDPINIAILGAVPREVEPLCPYLGFREEFEFPGGLAFLGVFAGKSILVAATGIGKVNAAVTAAVLLDRFRFAQVWNVGCAGAYPQGPLQMGDVLISTDFLIADEGVLTRNGPRSSEAIGIPVFTDRDRDYFDHIPADRSFLDTGIMRAAPAGAYHIAASPSSPCSPGAHIPGEDPPGARGNEPDFPPRGAEPTKANRIAGGTGDFSLVYGPSLTVGMASGDAGIAAERFSRFGAYAENMEGSAVAQACFRFGVPVLECRGISNTAGDRRKETWELEKALAHCHAIVRRLLEMN